MMSVALRLLGSLGGSAVVAAIPGVGPVIAFLTSPVGRVALVLLTVLGVAAVGWSKGYSYANTKYQRMVAQSELDAVRADLKFEKEAREADRLALDMLASEKLKAETDNEKLKAEIAALPLADQCVITPDRARRMR